MSRRLLILAFLGSIFSLLATLLSGNTINNLQDTPENVSTVDPQTNSDLVNVGLILAILTTVFASLATCTNFTLVFFGNGFFTYRDSSNNRETERLRPTV